MALNCQQHVKGGFRCINDACYRYTWPGQNEAVICETCAVKLRAIANAMGLPLQVIPLDINPHEAT
jgi:hypothetical protein